MFSSDTENDSDEERDEEILWSLQLGDFQDDVSSLIRLYNVDAYRWLLHATESSMVAAIMEPRFYKSASICDYMTDAEYKDFKHAISDHFSPRIPCTASPFMQTLIHFVTDVFHACDREPSVNSFDKFLTQLCMHNSQIMRVPKRPRKAPRAPPIFHRQCVQYIDPVDESKNQRNAENNN
jgi:hypothetical protein